MVGLGCWLSTARQIGEDLLHILSNLAPRRGENTMKSNVFKIILLVLLLAACSSRTTGGEITLLRVTDGTNEETFSVADLEKMPVMESTFNEVTYVGVSLTKILEEAGYSPQDLSAVKASASDGYSVNYDPGLFTR
jgi:hypothetical protein